jgi:Peptidase C13 family
MNRVLLTVGIALSFAFCGPAAAEPSATNPVLTQPTGWKAVLIAGDDREPAFDNAVDAIAQKLARFGVPRTNMTMLKATGSGKDAATLANVRDAFAKLAPARTDGCFVFVTSHGAQRRGLVLARDHSFLGPGELGALLDGACRERPTVVIASGCYSGSFAEGRSMPAANRTILTAARDDRTSFGCDAGRRFTVFDGCVLDSIDRGLTWLAVMTRTRGCVAKKRAGSRDQGAIGSATIDRRGCPRAFGLRALTCRDRDRSIVPSALVRIAAIRSRPWRGDCGPLLVTIGCAFSGCYD